MRDWRIRQDTVAEVEDERPAGERCQDVVDGAVKRRSTVAQNFGLEIALHRQTLLQLAGEIQFYVPAQRNTVDRGRSNVRQKPQVDAAWKADEFRVRHF